ncbi:DNA polymerase III subunit delta [Desulfurobacterium sp.]
MTEISAGDFIKQIKSGKIDKKKIFIHGNEIYLTKQVIKALSEKFETEKVDVNDNDFLNRLFKGATQSLFSQKEPFLIVMNINSLNSQIRKKSDKEKFIAFLKNSSGYLLVSETEIDKKTLNTELFKEILQHSDYTVVARHFDKKKIFQILKKKFETAGKEIDDETILFIIDTIGTDLQTLKVETDKLICFPHKLTKETVSELIFATKTTNIFSLITHILKKEKRDYIENLNILLSEGTEPLSLIALLQTQLRQIIEIKSGKKVRLPQKAIKEYINLTQKISLKELYNLLKTLHETEFAIKTGYRKPEEALKEIIFKEV